MKAKNKAEYVEKLTRKLAAPHAHAAIAKAKGGAA
jgi:hypothetical protein